MRRSTSPSVPPPSPSRRAPPSAADVARHPGVFGHAFVFAPPPEWDTAVPPQLLKLLVDFANKNKTTNIQGKRTEVGAGASAARPRVRHPRARARAREPSPTERSSEK